jgi:hypothetical protein
MFGVPKMRKRIHGKQSVPANILFSPERAMKFPTLVPVFLRCTKPLIFIPAGFTAHPARPAQVQSPRQTCRATQILAGSGISRTLYTSKALDQSNFIV